MPAFPGRPSRRNVVDGEKVAMQPDRPAEEMERFFDARARGYDTHIRTVIRSFDSFYACIAAQIPATDAAIRVLDLGCGTGLELGGIWARAPRASIRGIDLSAEMLARLQERWPGWASQLELDVPASLATQEALLGRAGLTGFRLRWREDDAAVYTATAPA